MQLSDYQARIQDYLPTCLPPESSGRLAAAMHYALLNGGKRLRAALLYAAGADSGIEIAQLDDAAAAIECIHAYSLIHDDLPAMDDDDWRRGKPSCHIAFGEAQAILAGDALNTLAFELLAESRSSPDTRLRQIAYLARAAGWAGMVGGQSLDMAMTGQAATMAQLQAIHRGKTAALIQAAILMGACPAQDFSAYADTLAQIGAELGMAYQIHDDILDASADSALLGKTAGKDAAQEKNTYVSLLGLAQSRRRLQDSRVHIDRLLGQLPASKQLGAVIAAVFERSH